MHGSSVFSTHQSCLLGTRLTTLYACTHPQSVNVSLSVEKTWSPDNRDKILAWEARLDRLVLNSGNDCHFTATWLTRLVPVPGPLSKLAQYALSGKSNRRLTTSFQKDQNSFEKYTPVWVSLTPGCSRCWVQTTRHLGARGRDCLGYISLLVWRNNSGEFSSSISWREGGAGF